MASRASISISKHIGKSTQHTIKKGWPATATVKLSAAPIKGCVASRAGVDAGCLVMLVLSRPGELSALQPEHPELLMHKMEPITISRADAPAPG